MEALTVAEAAALTEIEPRSIRKELELHVLEPVEKRPPRIALEQVAALKSVLLMGYHLNPDDRRIVLQKVLEGIVSRSSDVAIAVNVTMSLEPTYEFLGRVIDFFKWKSTLVTNPSILNGATTFPGTRYSVEGIGRVLRKGERTEDVLEDFPGLTQRDLDYARMFFEMYKPRGRPPRKSAQVSR